MAIYKSEDNKSLIITCGCGCDDGLKISVEKFSDEDYAFMTYLESKFLLGQRGVFATIGIKFKKIMAILFNKDYYYGEMILSKEDLEKLKKYIQEIK